MVFVGRELYLTFSFTPMSLVAEDHRVRVRAGPLGTLKCCRLDSQLRSGGGYPIFASYIIIPAYGAHLSSGTYSIGHLKRFDLQ
jgi:hypothetical protein